MKVRNNAYPLMGGSLLIKVGLKNEEDGGSWVENLQRSLKYLFVNYQARSYMEKFHNGDFPLVKLHSAHSSVEPVSGGFELNLFEDRMPIFNQLKIALGGITAAGILMLAASGAVKGTGGLMPAVNHNGGGNGETKRTLTHTGISREKTPVILVNTTNEEILLSSVIQPAENHPFQKVGHTDMAPTAHSNNPGSAIPHSNVPAYTDMTNPHANAFHSNTTTPHANVYHSNQIQPHSNQFHSNTVRPHANQFHSNQVTPHSNNAHQNGGHTNWYTDSP